MVELNDFRKLLIHRVLRPDTYQSKLHDYVNKMLDIQLIPLKWNDIIKNAKQCIIINLDKKSDIEVFSTINKLHQNLTAMAKKYEIPLVMLNCDNLNVVELNEEKEKIQSGLLVLKNIHLANEDVFDSIKSTCQFLNG